MKVFSKPARSVTLPLRGLVWAFILLLASCNRNGEKADAYGNFETDETTISAKVGGELVLFNIIEGQVLKAGEQVGLIDTLALHLQRAELQANLLSTAAQQQNVAAQIKVAKDELDRVQADQKRITAMYAKNAATQKQLDDINSAVNIAQNKLQVLQTQYPAIEAQIAAIKAKGDLLEKQLKDAVIINPVNGTVLAKLIEPNELAAPGKPLYTVADIQNLNLRAFISGDQLAQFKVGNTYTVKVDGPNGELISYPGELIWVAETAEFTPKNIQTKKDRVDLVYAIKLRVKNDGKLKLGMPGEVWLTRSDEK